MSAGDREAEAQAKKGEESNTSERDSRAAAALKQYWCLGLRIVELVIAIIGIGLMVGAMAYPQVLQSNHQHLALIFSAYSNKCHVIAYLVSVKCSWIFVFLSCFIIITGILILARLLGETVGWKTSIGFSIIGVVMFTAAAAVIFYDWHRSYYANMRPNKLAYDLLVTSGVFAVIDAAVFLVHAFLTFRKEADY